MPLDLTAFEKALTGLEVAIKRSKSEPEDEIVRDAVIQRFEYSYELSWKMLKRQLELELPTPSEVDQFSFKELIREGAERGFIDNAENWFVYREQRNITSHVYDEKKAIKVYSFVLKFILDAQKLLRELKKRNI